VAASHRQTTGPNAECTAIQAQLCIEEIFCLDHSVFECKTKRRTRSNGTSIGFAWHLLEEVQACGKRGG
jgi:hypothetical protein